jgi:hypothetical protein
MLKIKILKNYDIDSLFEKLSEAYHTLSKEEKKLLRNIFPLSAPMSDPLFELLAVGGKPHKSTLFFALKKIEDYVDADYLNFCHKEGFNPETGDYIKTTEKKND